MRKTAIVTLFLFLGLFVGTSSAVEVTLFGPNQYVRTTGPPNVYTDTFSAIPGQGKLIVNNGEEGGSRRISSALIVMNGEQVFGPSDFNQQVYHLETPINLTEDNSITVELRSGPGGYLTFEVTQEIPIELSITYPLEDDTISRPDVIVQGTITNATGNEIGVTVNGILAVVHWDQFVANDIPLEEGENTITATAIDTDGNTTTASININALTTGDYISLSSDTESGISPLETTLTIDGSFSFTESTLTYTGPGEVEFIESTSEEYRVRMTTEGIYYLTAEVSDTQDNTYTDTVAITVVNRAELDALLKAKWNGMKTALNNGDIERTTDYIAKGAREMYDFNLNLMSSYLVEMAAGLQDIDLVQIKDGVAEYGMWAEQDGKMYSFYILFVKDSDSIWRIQFF